MPKHLATSPIPSAADLMREGVRELRAEAAASRDASKSRSSTPEGAVDRDPDTFDFSAEAQQRLLGKLPPASANRTARRRRRARLRRLRENHIPRVLEEGEEVRQRRSSSWPGVPSAFYPLPILPEGTQPPGPARRRKGSAWFPVPITLPQPPSLPIAQSQNTRRPRAKKKASKSNGGPPPPPALPPAQPEGRHDEGEMFLLDEETPGTETVATQAVDVALETDFTQEETPTSNSQRRQPITTFEVATTDISDDDTENSFRERAELNLSYSLPAGSFPDEGLLGANLVGGRMGGFHPFSDTDLTPPVTRSSSRDASVSRVDKATSDTEIDRIGKETMTLEGLAVAAEEPEWKWGELPDSTPTNENPPSSDPKDKTDGNGTSWGLSNMLGLGNFMRQTKKVRHQPEKEGIYLDELINREEIDPHVAALYFPKSRRLSNAASAATGSGLGLTPPDPSQDDVTEAESGLATPIQAPPEENPVPPEALGDPGYSSGPSSLSGDANPPSASPKLFFDGDRISETVRDLALSQCNCVVSNNDPNSLRRFDRYRISYNELNNRPELLFDAKLVVRMNGKYYSGRVAVPMLISWMAFKKPLSEDTLLSLRSQEEELRAGSPTAVRKNTGDSSGARTPERGISPPPQLNLTADPTASSPAPSPRKTSWFYWSPRNTESDVEAGMGLPPSQTSPNLIQDGVASSSGSYDGSREDLSDGRHYKKVLRLNCDQLRSLGLRRGQNEVRFSVTTRMQGTAFCTCHIYLWQWDDRIVISDIDGTITKSDVMGQLLPMLGHQWAQAGVAKLYNAIVGNGYQILYLSARAIGQSSMTKSYLNYVRQDKLSLPQGPLLLSPSSLISAFHREVIEKKPEEFKKAALNDILALFPAFVNPFYAGFGNKINDVWAYQAAKVPTSKIFTINHLGELRHELVKGMTTSYCELNSQFVDLYFPVLVRKQAQLPPEEEIEVGEEEEKKRDREARASSLPVSLPSTTIPRPSLIFQNSDSPDTATDKEGIKSPPNMLSSTFSNPEQYSGFTFWRKDLPDDSQLKAFPVPSVSSVSSKPATTPSSKDPKTE